MSTYPYTRATLPPHGALIERVDSVGPTPTCACAVSRYIALYGESETCRWRYVPEDRRAEVLAYWREWPGACCVPEGAR